MATRIGTQRLLAPDAITNLRDRLRGQVILPGDGEYDDARKVWNGMIDKSPAIIVRPTETDDVVAAVDFARAHELPVAIRGGGHHSAGMSTCDDGMVIDLVRMRDIAVDPDRGTARVGGGATWKELDAATQVYGLAAVGGTISSTGVGGLTLGGGIGYLSRRYGLVCDNLIGAEVVTADGRVVHASADENPDLLWGLRGGGGNFGVVTQFAFRLHPVTEVLAGMILYPGDQVKEVLTRYRDVTRSSPDELGLVAAALHTPEGSPVCGFVPCYSGPIEQGEQILKSVREFGSPIVDQITPMPYIALQTMMDEGFPAGMQNYWRSNLLPELTDEVIDIATAYVSRVPSPLTIVLIEHLGGAVSRVRRDDTAFDHRGVEYSMAIVTRWIEPADADVNIAWTREFSEELKPHAKGVYVNYVGVDEGADRVKAAYRPDKYARLVALKNKYDPENTFRYNQNIHPSS